MKIEIRERERGAVTQAAVRGLSAREVEESRKRHGRNILSPAKKKSFMRKFFENLSDPVVKILIGALVINIIFMFKRANWVETVGIAVSILLATLISTLSEQGSQAAFERLSREGGQTLCRVIIGGETVEIEISDVVVGDMLLVGAGEQIAADGSLISGRLTTDQSAMTGESKEIKKRPRESGEREDVTPASPYYCLRGCTVISGSGIIEVRRVGDSTMLGGISREIQTDTRSSPLKIRLEKLAKQISVLGYILAVVVALVYLFNIFVIDSAFDAEIIKYKLTSLSYLSSHLFHALTLALTVVIVAVPEGLPMMIAVVLSSNIKRMIKDNVLVRKPVGIEAAGSMNILFTDKTGTLTEGKLSVGEIYLADGERFSSLSALRGCERVYGAYLLGAYANSSSVAGRSSKGKRDALGGNSTDRAIMLSAIKAGVRSPKYETIDKLEFDSARKYSAALVQCEGKRRVLIKGAPERILKGSSGYIDPDGRVRALDRRKSEEICSRLTREGKRVVAIAEGDGAYISSCRDAGSFDGLTLVCLITLEDRIRDEAKDAVETLTGAGIGVVMITGDNRETATSIAERCGIRRRGRDRVITGEELALMSDAEVKELIPSLSVVARALPNDKSRLVRLSGELELVVGMTGDGINDAPALKRADVGFAMGSGTQVAKDAGDIIIIDNNLSSIARAVLYGRTVFKSIRKFISLQLIMNLSAVGVSVICPFLGFDSPVTVVQMLWINIIMDTLGGLAFAGEAPLASYMQERPKRRDEPILNGYMINEILLSGAFTVAICIAFLKIPEISCNFRASADNIYLLTGFFALFIFASVFNCFNSRTDRLKLWSGITKNKTFILIMAAVLAIQIAFVYLGGEVLRTAPLTLRELLVTAAVALFVFPAELLRKLLFRLLFGKRGY
ncbi:MAG: calcium-translocating P-type ATPase, PMCA-type [Clostridia bacterium]|nr:calcium-translocating P-type ATPase, PMCA-type [Clostridia bacterium]